MIILENTKFQSERGLETLKILNYKIDLSAGAQEASFEIYNKILTDHSLDEICRIWNFVPDIHALDHGDERYRQFCFGRYLAFKKHNYGSSMFPAASAVGTFDENLEVNILLTNGKIVNIENDLQMSAFNYPKQYGRVGPSFSRASIALPNLYISGTASIRGHETLFEGDLQSQTALSVDNIYYLIEKANSMTERRFSLNHSCWHVYLRDPQNKMKVQQLLEKLGLKKVEFTHAQICREDLLVEIEGICFGSL